MILKILSIKLFVAVEGAHFGNLAGAHNLKLRHCDNHRRVRCWVGGRTVGQMAVCVDLWLGK